MTLTELRNTGRLNHRGLLLAIGKPRGLPFVGVNAAKPLSVGVKNCHQPMAVLAALVGSKLRYFSQ